MRAEERETIDDIVNTGVPVVYLVHLAEETIGASIRSPARQNENDIDYTGPTPQVIKNYFMDSYSAYNGLHRQQKVWQATHDTYEFIKYQEGLKNAEN